MSDTEASANVVAALAAAVGKIGKLRVAVPNTGLNGKTLCLRILQQEATQPSRIRQHLLKTAGKLT
ncbi:MAG: hypothetical protein ACRBM6_25690 [Geminicoccales bacterium]